MINEFPVKSHIEKICFYSVNLMLTNCLFSDRIMKACHFKVLCLSHNMCKLE